MAQIIGEIVGRVLIELVGAVIEGAIRSYGQERRSKKSNSSSQKHNRSLTSVSPSSAQYTRAVLIASSNITFGNDCERLVNIAFQSSQTFPTMMGTCADVNQYLHKELAKQYPNEYFHIIIGENKKFGFSISEDQHFAEIEQDRYRVLIFSTKQNSHTKSDTHDANSQMLFVWN
ncbi:unnamed protein product [Rotaria sordida]|uniref:Uncharacterized protein n=1 Tax=Rotaria sordida TaxID=392033 RepID=A0A813PLJ7_9BILA|nr:unnamed protein product [Rotaria sordida]CAF0769862.1 unnamed protein product [Rotaria sordida]CAF3480010.1 unnamed protein product [Rotaria sordida]CAF3747092.1 unnamed protein product [Rotaria sordida]